MVGGHQLRVPWPRTLSAGGTAWGTRPDSVPSLSLFTVNHYSVPRSAAGVFKVAFGEGSGSRSYTVTVTAVWEINITGVTAAGLAVKEADGATDFCDSTDTSGRTDGGGTCIREMRLSTELSRGSPRLLSS